MANPIPLTLLTGFLGSGKTTLLNQLLRQPEMAGTAVLVNEFGEIGLDHELITRVEGDTVLLASGCLCCTVRGDLSRALEELAPRVQSGAINRVVIETTGLADPAPIIGTLLGIPFLAAMFRLDGVVTVVDAVHGLVQLSEHPEAIRQVAVADRLVVSKSDIADAGKLMARLATLNPTASIILSNHGAVAPNMLLASSDLGSLQNQKNWIGADKFDETGHVHDHGHHHHHHHDVNRHDESIRAYSFVFDQPLHWQGIGTWLEMLASTRGENLLRVKGILDLAGQDRPVVINGVRDVFHPPELLPAWPEGQKRQSRLVFIVRDLKRETLLKGMQAFEEAAI